MACSLEKYFQIYRENIVGFQQTFNSVYGEKQIVYADWTASGRTYRPIEEKILNEISPFIGNTHTETTVTGSSMTLAYNFALKKIKKHVNASDKDVIICCNSGMTGAINKFQRILGLKICEKYKKFIQLEPKDKPVVFITHMEHHSNQTTWLETIADVVCVPPNEAGLVDLKLFEQYIQEYKDRPYKIAAITACSNVTGIKTPYYDLAELIHKYNGWCFLDFACSAPYVDIDMHPEKASQKIDAIYFSPHKFLGGPGTPGVLIFDSALYSNTVPDHPGGGTVDWTNPWGGHKYIDDIEAREDGGTPPFLQTIRTALAVQLKEEMGTKNIWDREQEMLDIIWENLSNISNLHILAPNVKKRLGIVSFYIDNLHYNLAVKLLNDRYGIQVRGGCSCAGTYGHYLLNVSQELSSNITNQIDFGDYSSKPGWVRLSIHPTMTDKEVTYLVDAIKELAKQHETWSNDYYYSNKTNEFMYKNGSTLEHDLVNKWFKNAALKV